MDLKPVKSDLVSQESYDPSTKVLRLVMKSNGKHYDYQNVEPHQYRDFLAAESKGEWFHKNLGGKNNERHPFFPATPPAE